VSELVFFVTLFEELLTFYLEVVSKPSIRFKVKAADGFKHRNTFNISSIESLGPTLELGLRVGFETNSNIYLDVLGTRSPLPSTFILNALE
jgi:hypothetical protein